jgi:hypothetical protein
MTFLIADVTNEQGQPKANALRGMNSPSPKTYEDVKALAEQLGRPASNRDDAVAKGRRIAITEIMRVVFAASGTHSLGGTTQGNKAMTTQEITTHDSEVENIRTAAQADAGFEKLLKFKKGEYFIGEVSVPLGTKYVAHAVGWTKCWIKFVDGEVAERKTYRVALGEKPPERDELDDNNEADWPLGLDDRPADPWVYQYLLPLEDPSSSEVIIFVTASFGGRRAIAELCDAYAKRTKRMTNCGQPIIKLSKMEMPTKKFGKVPRPLFEISGWDEVPGDFEVTPPATSEGEFEDEIPF